MPVSANTEDIFFVSDVCCFQISLEYPYQWFKWRVSSTYVDNYFMLQSKMNKNSEKVKRGIFPAWPCSVNGSADKHGEVETWVCSNVLWNPWDSEMEPDFRCRCIRERLIDWLIEMKPAADNVLNIQFSKSDIRALPVSKLSAAPVMHGWIPARGGGL